MAMGGHGFREGTACACLAAARPTRCPGPLLAYALPPALPPALPLAALGKVVQNRFGIDVPCRPLWRG